MGLRNWVRSIVVDTLRDQSKSDVAISGHEVSNGSKRSWQIWEIKNGYLLCKVDNYDSTNEGRLTFYPSLEALHEGMVTAGAAEKLWGQAQNQQYAAAASALSMPYANITNTKIV